MLRFATPKLSDFSLFSHSVIAFIKISKMFALEITVYTPIAVAKQYKLQKKKYPEKAIKAKVQFTYRFDRHSSVVLSETAHWLKKIRITVV